MKKNLLSAACLAVFCACAEPWFDAGIANYPAWPTDGSALEVAGVGTWTGTDGADIAGTAGARVLDVHTTQDSPLAFTLAAKQDVATVGEVVVRTRVTITPKAGLQPGTYTDTLYVHTENGAVHFITVTLTVTPKPEEPQQEADAALSGVLAAITGAKPFSDVPGGAYYNAAVRWAVKNGIASGTDAKHFSPDAACTCGQIVTFLYRANA